MVPKHLKKSNESLGGDQESLMASYIELQGRIKNDKSILRQPIDTGVRGVRDLMKAVVGGTQELQELLLNECTIIYECKICRNLFRSLANFISHKRIYCIKSYTYFTEAASKQEKDLQSDITLESEMVNCNEDVKLNETKVWLTSEKLVPNNIKTEKNNYIKPTRRIKISPVKITRKCDIAKIADGLSRKVWKDNLKASEEVPGSIYYSDLGERVLVRRTKQKSSLQLENLSNNCKSEVFEDRKESYKNDFRDCTQLELFERIAPSNEAVLQENGKFRVTPQGMQLEDNENFEKYKCSICETLFITQQTLSRHVQIHHKERICYPCPICRTFFPSPSSTYRHLSKDHHKTEQQIRRLRPKVLAKARKRKLVDGSSNINKQQEQKSSTQNSYIEGVLRCTSCGKLFNRQAVLRVHLSSCKERQTSKGSPNTQKSSTTEISMKPSPKLIVPPDNDLNTCKPAPQKSGILVRRDYSKKFNCNTKTFTTQKSTVKENHSCKGHSLKRVNKWKTILQKLQSRTGFDMIEKNDCK